MPHYLFSSKDELKFLGEHLFWQGNGLVWCEPEDHPFFQHIHFATQPLFYSSYISNHPGEKQFVRQVVSGHPNSSDDLLPSLLSLSLFYAVCCLLMNWKREPYPHRMCQNAFMCRIYLPVCGVLNTVLGAHDNFRDSVVAKRKICRLPSAG